MLNAATLMVLAPISIMEANYRGEMEANVWRPDNETRRYQARSAGEAKGTLDFEKPKRQLGMRVTTNNMNSIMFQLIKDAAFYQLRDNGHLGAGKPPI